MPRHHRDLTWRHRYGKPPARNAEAREPLAQSPGSDARTLAHLWRLRQASSGVSQALEPRVTAIDTSERAAIAGARRQCKSDVVPQGRRRRRRASQALTGRRKRMAAWILQPAFGPRMGHAAVLSSKTTNRRRRTWSATLATRTGGGLLYAGPLRLPRWLLSRSRRHGAPGSPRRPDSPQVVDQRCCPLGNRVRNRALRSVPRTCQPGQRAGRAPGRSPSRDRADPSGRRMRL